MKPVVPGGAGDAFAPPDFDRSINPISIKWGILCPPSNIGTPGFSDLPMANYFLKILSRPICPSNFLLIKKKEQNKEKEQKKE